MVIEDHLPRLVNHLLGTSEADGGDLSALGGLGGGRDDVGLDVEGTIGDVLAGLPKVGEVLSMDRQFADLDIIGSIDRMCPSHDSILIGMEDILGVGPGEVGREGDVEGVVDDGIAGRLKRLGHRYRGSLLRQRIAARLVHGVRVHRHVGVGTTHAEVGAHPLGPVTHIGKLVHDGPGS